MSGRVQNLYLKTAHKQPMKAVDEAQAEDGMGLVGDVSFGRSKRQVLLIEKETLDEFGLTSGIVRENVTVTGVALSGLPTGTLIKLGDAVLEVTGDCHPCRFLEDIRPGLQNDMRGRRGILGRILEGGTIRVGDSVAILEK
ncbi:MAG: MOSC domain-containing protein [Chloroflexota bacterium]|jgi:MOSC domain-containing protein YiiM